MPEFKENYCLKNFNTFGVPAKAKYFAEFYSITELKSILDSEIYNKNNIFILGEGSNILLTQDFEGLIIKNKITGISILEDNKNSVTVEVGAGVNWHEFVEWSVKKNLSGIENLALIPGTVGASPIQNIGAYGMEVKDTITKVHSFNLINKKKKIFDNQDCKFEYRNSIFKLKLKNKIIISKVEFKLFKKPLNKITYGAIQGELKSLNLKPSPINIANAVINIRKRKLPNPSVLGNSGSFFKNPIIPTSKFERIKKVYPRIVGYKESGYTTKIAAGWLIENAGLKGHRDGKVGVHKNQALVLVNYGNATGREILELSKKIQHIVFEKYEIHIEPEVNII